MLEKFTEKLTEPRFAFTSFITGWVVAAVAMYLGINLSHEQVSTFMSEGANNQIVQAGFFFTIASWIHSGRVKKEIKNSFNSLTEAINNVASSLREDLKKHSEKIDNHTEVIHTLDSRVTSLETTKT